MDDLISRQDAIDAIKKFKHGAAEWRDEQEEHSDIWHRADSAIASAIEIGLRVKKIPSAQQWIPCSETVDIPDHEVLACDKLGEIIIGYLAYHDEQWICESETEFMYGPITWMPLPKPYREEDNSEL